MPIKIFPGVIPAKRGGIGRKWREEEGKRWGGREGRGNCAVVVNSP